MTTAYCDGLQATTDLKMNAQQAGYKQDEYDRFVGEDHGLNDMGDRDEDEDFVGEEGEQEERVRFKTIKD